MSRRWTVGAVLAVAMGVAVAMGLLGCATTATSWEPADLVIRDVRLFDGERVHQRAVVVVRDGRIVAAGPGVTVPPAAEVVDGSGHTLLPGLIDAHVHTFTPQALEASLAFGVTTVLDTFTAPALLGAWLSEQATGRATSEHVIPWSEFQGADGRGVMGIAFVAMQPREFELWLDDVALRSPGLP